MSTPDVPRVPSPHEGGAPPQPRTGVTGAPAHALTAVEEVHTACGCQDGACGGASDDDDGDPMACGLDPALAELLAAQGLDPATVEDIAYLTLSEDLDGGVDVTTVATVPEDAVATADFTAREDGVVAGVHVAEAVLSLVCEEEFEVERHVADGDRITAGQQLLSVTARTRDLLTAERSALNLLCRLSGIATATRTWADALDGTKAKVRDTRKTTPGLRVLEKFAVRCGGGVNHRMSLSDAALVKDNHVVAAGGVAEAFAAVRTAFPDIPIEVEVDTLHQLREVLDAGADLILLDNFTVVQTGEAVALVQGRAFLESSGRLTLQDARAYAVTGVDYLSVGALTHSARILDIGLDLRAPQPRKTAADTAADGAHALADAGGADNAGTPHAIRAVGSDPTDETGAAGNGAE